MLTVKTLRENLKLIVQKSTIKEFSFFEISQEMIALPLFTVHFQCRLCKIMYQSIKKIRSGFYQKFVLILNFLL